jgi:hypothetical protein
MTIACVLRSGGIYHPGWVQRLAGMVEEHMPGALFVCLTDTPVPGVESRPLLWEWPGWFAKMELFCPGTFKAPVLYLDLDSDVVGDLSGLTSYDGPLALLSDFNRPARAQTGVMAFTPGAETERLWALWKGNADGWLRQYESQGAWMHDHAPTADRIQTLFPGQIVSYKNDCCVHTPGRPQAERTFMAVPEGARIVAYHGDQKPNMPAWERPALVIGAAECVLDDLEALEGTAPLSAFEVFAANDGGVIWPGRLDHWCSLHPDELPERRRRREAAGGPNGYLTWSTHGGVDRILPHDFDVADGGSAVLASCVARYLGRDRKIVWAGCPITPTPYQVEHMHHGKGAWPHANIYQRALPSLVRQKSWLSAQIRSMSGFSAELFGKPDRAWLGLPEPKEPR